MFLSMTINHNTIEQHVRNSHRRVCGNGIAIAPPPNDPQSHGIRVPWGLVDYINILFLII